MNFCHRLGIGLALSLISSGAMAAEGDIDNGTDPTKLSRNAQIRYEMFDLGNGFSNNTLYLRFTEPLGAAQKSSLEFKLPIVSTDVLGDSD